ncbi:MAG: DUF4384 domain-containing protein [Sulfitobacter sp.]
MRKPAGIWLSAGTISVALNLGIVAGLMAAMQPQPVPDQTVPESRLNVEAQKVARSDAREQAPESQSADETATDGAKLDGGAITQSVAKPRPPSSKKAPVQNPPNAVATILPPPAPDVAVQTPDTVQADVKRLSAWVAVALQPHAFIAKPATIVVSTTGLQTAQSDSVAPSAPILLAGLSQTPASTPAAQQPPANIPTAPQVPEVTSGTAMLAFPTSGPVDPVSFAAFQSFMQPSAAAGADVRDSLSAALSLPCSRMQVTFDPETTTLNVTGHVPDAAQRAPVLAALQAQMGADIAVAENLLVLPAPQCGALAGIANVGLPQSTDQITNRMIVGDDTHARAFRYVAGDPLVMSLSAPDYPAYVYVDYFDADGNVIHLSPNDRAPLQAVKPKTALQIGAASADEPGLFVTIGPPYGQEIAAAFAASAPLYDGTRPLVEPAGAYLSWLKDRVTQAREKHADFKGEWVYFFVTTAAD